MLTPARDATARTLSDDAGSSPTISHAAISTFARESSSDFCATVTSLARGFSCDHAPSVNQHTVLAQCASV
ncbi:hypothetical protein GOTRE_175_01470 [Gordonia terrae NBRC 100016]|uniref:Uncharacterized protein n=1 Tax=Gordonia terrae NBRC 100016 TaxID=1089454 RepID=A0ABQ0HL99_9ACTN|nr:hypothetical protein GOTRE_175_01470 [Gordonia terrae NBRC 100016]